MEEVKIHKKILWSRNYHEYVLIFDGKDTYHLFIENKLKDTFKTENKIKPSKFKDLYFGENIGRLNSRIFQEMQTNPEIYGLDGNGKEDDFIKWIVPLIDKTLENETPNTKLNYLTELLRTIKNTVNNQREKTEYMKSFPDEILEYISQISENIYPDAEAKDLINQDKIHHRTDREKRIDPILSDKEKRISEKVKKSLNKEGFQYIINILKKIHKGEQKNILRKMLMAFSIMRGEASFLSETVAEAETGKSFEDKIVFEYIIPDEYIFSKNDMTYSAFSRYSLFDEYFFDRLIIVFGDLGSDDDFKKVKDVFNIIKVLITENKYSRGVSEKRDDEYTPEDLNLRVDSIGAVYSTTINSFTEDDNQLLSRTLKATPKEVDTKEILENVFYLFNPVSDASIKRNEAINELKEVGIYLKSLVNPTYTIINPYINEFMQYVDTSESPIRELKQQLSLFNSYCLLTKDKAVKQGNYWFASVEQLSEYMNLCNLENALIPYEYDFLKMIMASGNENRELYVLSDESDNIPNEKMTLSDVEEEVKSRLTEYYDFGKKLLNMYGLRGQSIEHQDERIFFRVSDIRNTYYQRKAYKNINNVSKLLNTLYNKGYLGKCEYKYGKENIYFLTSKCAKLTNKFDPESVDEWESITNYIKKSGMTTV